MFHGFIFIWVYIDNLLIITKSDWSNHLKKVELRIQKLKDNGLKCDMGNLSLAILKRNTEVSG